jgi:sulfonate transport system substrate-binding protein
MKKYKINSSPASHQRIIDYFLLTFITCLLTWTVTLTGCTQQNSPQAGQSSTNVTKPNVVNIGHQKGTPGLNLLKAQQLLEKRLTPEGINVKWIEFRGGPPMMEAMASGNVDIGNVGNLPPIFAQAGGNQIVYVAATASNAGAQAIVVPSYSPIKTLADLKGKKLAIQKGTALQYLALKALESAKLTLNDIKPVYLNIPDSITAFEGGQVDALPISDPYYAQKEKTGQIRILVKGSDVAPQRAYYIATQNFAQKHPELVKTILEEQRKVEDWAKSHKNEVAQLLAKQTEYDTSVWEYALGKRSFFGVFDITDEFVREQQQVVDLFYKQKLIPKDIQIKDAVWKT